MSQKPIMQIDRDGAIVNLRITVENGDTFPFKFECSQEWIAKLLVTAIRNALYAASKAMHADEYERGWKDAKAKRAKTTWWPSRLP